MKVFVTVDPEIPIPPMFYGGIERIVDMLVRGLISRGHDVTLFANRGSSLPCRVVPWPGESSSSTTDTLRNMLSLSRYVLAEGCDVLHSFSRLSYMLPLLPLGIPKLMTYQRAITPRSVIWGHRLSRGTLRFSAISDWMIEETRHLADWQVVYNAAPLGEYDFQPAVQHDAPLVFIGRIEEIKGTHLAIEIARRSSRRLVIAGNIPRGHRDYFERMVRPHIDGDCVKYVGPIDDREKNVLLGQAAALVMAVLWDEPFGIVMAEALACGTPVLGLRRGAVPEVVEDGVSGFVRDDIDGLVAVTSRLCDIDRAACRARAERLFSDTVMVDRYLEIYRRLIALC